MRRGFLDRVGFFVFREELIGLWVEISGRVGEFWNLFFLCEVRVLFWILFGFLLRVWLWDVGIFFWFGKGILG